MALKGTPCNPKAIIFFSLTCLLVVPSIGATVFRLCHPDNAYKVKIKGVQVSFDLSPPRELIVKYNAHSDVNISKGRVRVDTFTYYEEDMGTPEPQLNSDHPFCDDTTCPTTKGDDFQAAFKLRLPSNHVGTMSLRLRLVDNINGNELTCVIITFDVDESYRASLRVNAGECIAQFIACNLSW